MPNVVDNSQYFDQNLIKHRGKDVNNPVRKLPYGYSLF